MAAAGVIVYPYHMAPQRCRKFKGTLDRGTGAVSVSDNVPTSHKQLVLQQATNSTKRRQSTYLTRHDVVESYKQDVSCVWEDRTTTYNTWFNPEGLTLNCKSIEPSRLPAGFVRVGNERYQYNFSDPEALSKAERYRPVAYRVPFISDPGYYDKAMTVSHLCHNNWCYNWDHCILEPLAVNKARNGCPAGSSCRHKTKCLIPGKFSDS